MTNEKTKTGRFTTVERIARLFKEAEKLSATDPEKTLQMFREIVKLAKQEHLTDELLRAYIDIGILSILKGDDKHFLYYLKKVLKLATDNKNYDYQHLSLTKLGAYYWNHSNFKKARQYFEGAQTLHPKVKHSRSKLTNTRGLAMTYIKLDQWDKADKLLKKGQLYAKKIGNEIEQANLTYWKGFLEYERIHYDLALKKYMESLKIFEQNSLNQDQSMCLNSIGLLYRDIGEPNQALAYFKKSRDKAMGEEKGSVNRLADVYNNIGLIHRDLGDDELAIINYKKSLKYREATGDIAKEAITLVNISNIYTCQKKYDLAHDNISKALKLKRKVGNINELTHGLHSAINTYCLKQDLLPAEKYVTELIGLLDKITNKNAQIHSYGILSEFYEKKRDFEKALEYNKKYCDESQKLFDESMRKKIYDEEYKRRIERIKLRNKYKLEKDRIKTVLAMSCTMSHELNQPLMVIQGSIDLMSMRFGAEIPEKEKQHLDNINKSIERIKEILDKLNKVQQVSFSKYYQPIDILDIKSKNVQTNTKKGRKLNSSKQSKSRKAEGS
jgi:hypothetical protein